MSTLDTSGHLPYNPSTVYVRKRDLKAGDNFASDEESKNLDRHQSINEIDEMQLELLDDQEQYDNPEEHMEEEDDEKSLRCGEEPPMKR